jgi:hypothetical protein
LILAGVQYKQNFYEERKNMGKKVKRRLLAGGILLALSFFLMAAAQAMPAAAEWYAESVYRWITRIVGSISGVFPFSLAEICLYILLAAFVITLIRAAVKGRKNKDLKGESARWLSCCFFAGALLFFLYVINCGINYQRVSFSEKEGFPIEGYTDEELANVCLWLTEEINDRSVKVKRDEDGQMKAADNVRNEAARAMRNLGEFYPSLEGDYPGPRSLFCHRLCPGRI